MQGEDTKSARTTSVEPSHATTDRKQSAEYLVKGVKASTDDESLSDVREQTREREQGDMVVPVVKATPTLSVESHQSVDPMRTTLSMEKKGTGSKETLTEMFDNFSTKNLEARVSETPTDGFPPTTSSYQDKVKMLPTSESTQSAWNYLDQHKALAFKLPTAGPTSSALNFQDKLKTPTFELPAAGSTTFEPQTPGSTQSEVLVSTKEASGLGYNPSGGNIQTLKQSKVGAILLSEKLHTVKPTKHLPAVAKANQENPAVTTAKTSTVTSAPGNDESKPIEFSASEWKSSSPWKSFTTQVDLSESKTGR